MKITIFSEELRKCLSAAGLSDCGENDTWNYWYQRLMNAYNEAVERQIATEQAENAKLRELLKESLMDYKLYAKKYGLPPYLIDVNEHLDARLRELGIELNDCE